ncbi:MAG: hypothetical protein NT027_12740 [Proteobacteria bacterium]|nr:hypothetical protein [Pseudomonadota bacterium]
MKEIEIHNLKSRLIKSNATKVNFLVALGLASIAAACSNSAPTNESTDKSISDVTSLYQLPDGRFSVTCKNGKVETRTQAEVLANAVCSNGIGNGNFVYANSDSCDSSSLIGAVSEFTECSTFGAGKRSWSIKTNGTCDNISDTTATNACYIIQSKMPQTAVLYNRSDSCDSSYIATAVKRNTQCSTLGNGAVWSYSYLGQCFNISDTTMVNACFEAQGNLPGMTLIYGRTDSCDANGAIATVDSTTDCNSLSSNEASWSIRQNGQCININDTSVRQACFQAQGAF